MAIVLELDSLNRDRQTYPDPCVYELTPKNVDTWVSATRDVTALPKNPNQRPLDFVSSLNVLCATLPYPRIELFAPTFVTVDNVSAGNVFNTIGVNGLVNGDILMTSSPAYTAFGISPGQEYHVINATPTTFQLSLLPGGVAITAQNGTGLNMTLAVLTAADYATVIAELNTAKSLLNMPRVYLDFHSRTYNDTRSIRTINGVNSAARFVLVVDRVTYSANLTPMWIHYKSMEQVMRFRKDDMMVIAFMDRNGNKLTFFSEDDLTMETNPQKQSLITIEVTPYARDNTFSNHEVDPIN
jgi:hypothetical protein